MERITMKHLTIFILSTIISNIAMAEFEIPNEFEDGQVTSASQMNENFQALKAEIEILKAHMEGVKNTNGITFIGVTEEKFNGSGGYLAMGQACNRMSSGSFFCSLDDYSSSIKPLDLIINSDARINDNGCSNFSNNMHSGNFMSKAINTNGVIFDAFCSHNYSVACCK